MFEALIYTTAAVLLYLVSDWILQRLELRAGRRFEHRSFVFFFIITVLAVSSFAIVQHFLTNR